MKFSTAPDRATLAKWGDQPIRPPLKWAGGKRWQIPHLRPFWEAYRKRRLVEPFCGGAAVALSLRPAHALLNDINPHLVNFYAHLRRGLFIDLPMRNEEELFYTHRSRFNALLPHGRGDSAEAAALFYYLNRTGYNGLCRFNSKGAFNVPFGRYKEITYCRDFSDYRSILSGWTFSNVDFESISVKRGDFIYADPPYDVQFTAYSQGGFAWEDQVRAAQWLSKHPGPVVASNQATPRIMALYKKLGFATRVIAAPRMISCKGDRAPAKELLATRNL